MSGLRKVVLLALLVLWAPITVHCRLASISGLRFLLCCQHEGSAPHQDADCAQDACAVVESGAYRIEDNSDLPAAPALAFAFVTMRDELVVSPLRERVTARAACSPLEVAQAWQFFNRAALPPRAPSTLA